MSFFDRSTILAGLDGILRTYVRLQEARHSDEADAGFEPRTRTLMHGRACSPRWTSIAKADAGIRTPDPFLTMEVLYRLSYVGAGKPILARTFSRRDALP